MSHVRGVADLALLAVVDDIDARLDLLADDVRDGAADARVERGGIERRAGVEGFEHRREIGGAR